MNIKELAMALSVIAAILVGALWYSYDPPVEPPLGATPTTRVLESGRVVSAPLLSATSTHAGGSGAPKRLPERATSSPQTIEGAKKAVFTFGRKGTTTTGYADYGTTTFQVMVSMAGTYNEDSYRPFPYLQGATSSPGTSNAYDARQSIFKLYPKAGQATTTAFMDLTNLSYRSLICVASTTKWAPATCEVRIEY